MKEREKHICPRCKEQTVQIVCFHPICFHCSFTGEYYASDEKAIEGLAQVRVLEDIKVEREKQDDMRALVDEDMNGGDYIVLIRKFALKANDSGRGGNTQEMRRRLIQVAAIAVAAVESLDKHEKQKEK